MKRVDYGIVFFLVAGISLIFSDLSSLKSHFLVSIGDYASAAAGAGAAAPGGYDPGGNNYPGPGVGSSSGDNDTSGGGSGGGGTFTGNDYQMAGGFVMAKGFMLGYMPNGPMSFMLFNVMPYSTAIDLLDRLEAGEYDTDANGDHHIRMQE
jgi:hypothetical protein